MFSEFELDEMRQLYNAKFSYEDIAIFYDYDITEDFLKQLTLQINKEYQRFFILGCLKPPLNEKEVKKYRKKIDDKRNSPERLNRILTKEVTKYADSLGKMEDIVDYFGKSKEELSEILGEPFDIFLKRHHAKARLDLRFEQMETAKVRKDSKMQIFLGEKNLEEQREVSKDVNIAIDGRKIIYCELPKPDDGEDFTKYWTKPEIEK